jgi:hypothetical protein
LRAFEAQLTQGQLGETIIANWLKSRGSWLLPAYEKEIDTGKGPRLFGAGKQLVTPDFFAFPSLQFIEAKHKTVFSWHHKTKTWCTGIDLHHYEDYQEVQRNTARPVWLLFLHRRSVPDTADLNGRDDCPECGLAGGSCCPPECPTGLFGRPLSFLVDNEHHRDRRWGRHGMIYWAHEVLKELAPMSEMSAFFSVAT